MTKKRTIPLLPGRAPRERCVGLPALFVSLALALLAFSCPAGYADAPAVPVRALVVGSELGEAALDEGQSERAAAGFMTELWQAIAKEKGWAYELMRAPFPHLLEQLAAGKMDMVLSSREEHDFVPPVLLSNPLISTHAALFVRRGDTGIHSEKDLVDKTVIVVSSDPESRRVLHTGPKHLVTVSDVASGMQMLASGNSDAILADRLSGLHALRTLALTNVRVADPNVEGSQKSFAIAVGADNRQLLAEINEGLESFRADGTYALLYDKWFGPVNENPIPRDQLLRHWIPAGGVVVVLCLAMLYQRALTRRLAQSRDLLGQREAMLAEAQGIAHLGNWTYDPATHTVEWSDETYRIMGRDPAAFVPTDGGALKQVHPEDREKVLALYNRVLSGEKECQGDFRVCRTDGEIRWVQLNGRTIFAGRPLLLGTVLDITERKRAKDELERSLAILHATTEATADGLLVLDQTGRVQICNRRFEQIWPVEEGVCATLDKTRLLERLAPHLAVPQAFASVLGTLEADSRTESFDVVPLKDGRTFELYSWPLKVREQCVGRVWTFRDVTARAKAERWQAAQLHVLQLIAGRAPLPVAVDAVLRGLEEQVPGAACTVVERREDQRLYSLARRVPEPLAARFASSGHLLRPQPGDPDGPEAREEWESAKGVSWTIPITSGDGTVLAKLVVRLADAAKPTEEALRLAGMAAHLICQAIERRNAESRILELYASLEKRVRERTAEIEEANRRLTVEMADRNRAEKLLRESEQRYRSVVDNLKEVVFQTDADGAWVFLNLAWKESLGYDLNDSIGRPFLDFVHPEDRKLNEERFLPLIRGEKDYCRHEIRYLHAEGGFRWMEVFARLTFDKDGRVIGTSGTLNDVTERRRALVALRESEQRLERALHGGDLGTWDWTIPTGESRFNQRWLEMLGYRPGELQPDVDSWRGLLHPDDWPIVLEKMNAHLEGKTSFYEAEQRLRAKSGEWKWILARGRVSERDAEGNPLRVVGTHLDITDRKRAEEDLVRAKETAEQASRAKSEFLSSMSHELRTPLNAILGFSQLLKSDPAEPLSSLQAQWVDQIATGGWHLLELINEVLDLAKIEAGRIELNVEPVAVADVIHACLKLSGPIAEKQGIRLENRVSDCLNAKVRGDRTRLTQILLNLVSNAIKYNRPDGSVSLAVERLPSGRLRIAVTDTGAGLSESQLSSLFQSFNRLGAEAGAVEGTGIGLVISKRLVEMMGGAIGVSSVVGTGSTFWIELGLADDSEYAAGSASAAVDLESRGTDGNCSVLYIEDNPANVTLVTHMLRHRPALELITAPDARLGLEYARARSPDLILLDINLPGMNGYELKAHLDEEEETRDIPVIALSANAMPEEIEKGMSAGFRRYLTKPIDLGELLAAIDEVLLAGGGARESRGEAVA